MFEGKTVSWISGLPSLNGDVRNAPAANPDDPNEPKSSTFILIPILAFSTASRYWPHLLMTEKAKGRATQTA